MRPIGADTRCTGAALACGAALLLGLSIGCGSDPKTEPKKAAAATTTAPKKADESAMPPPPNSPTASAITIDDAILKACGIEAPKAHFAFDSANMQSQDTSTLEQVARCFT